MTRAGWCLARAGAVHRASHVGGSGRAGPQADTRRARARSGDSRDARGPDAWDTNARGGAKGNAWTGDAASGHTNVLTIDDGLGRRGNREESQPGS